MAYFNYFYGIPPLRPKANNNKKVLCTHFKPNSQTFKKNENMKMWYSPMMEVKMLSTKLVSGYSFSTFLDE